MSNPRDFLLAILALIALAVGVGAPMTALPVLTRAVLLAIPDALAIPAGVPPLWGPGTEPTMLWVVNLIAAGVMIVTAWWYMTAPRKGRSSRGAEPVRGEVLTRAAVWRRVVVGVMLGLVLANVVRAVAWSFYTGPSLAVYGSTVALSAVLSAVVGAIIGALVGAVAAIARPQV